jgi:hypothetical protein
MRKLEEKSDPQIRRNCQETDTKMAGSWVGALEGMITYSEQLGKTWW